MKQTLKGFLIKIHTADVIVQTFRFFSTYIYIFFSVYIRDEMQLLLASHGWRKASWTQKKILHPECLQNDQTMQLAPSDRDEISFQWFAHLSSMLI